MDRYRSSLHASLHCVLIAIALSLVPDSLCAQQDSVSRRDSTARARRDSAQLLPPVTVTREARRSPLELPFGISVLRPDSVRPGQTHTQLDETLQYFPGVSVASRDNPSQDPRVSIRGFGARSQFGVRSIKILRDGMPLTLPDGQTPVDYLDLESVGRVEVIRGSAAALYGNAGGGVIDIRSTPAPGDPLALQLRGWGGSHGFERYTGLFGGTFTNGTYQGNVGYTSNDGYRAYSHLRTTNYYGKTQYQAGGTTLGLQIMGVNTPTAENPGALTAAQFDSAPQMADPLQVTKRSRKAVSQVQVGLSARRPIGDATLDAQVYGGTRSLFNPQSFAIVDVQRTSYGGTVRGDIPAQLLHLPNRFTVGVDLQKQDDDRRNWANCNAVSVVTATCPDLIVASEKGVLQLDQTELVSSIGPYVRDEIAFGDRYDLSLGVRADVVRFEVQDHLITPTDPDNSGSRTLNAVSPLLGFVARVTPTQSAYANISSAFETPTTTELGNQPDGSAGLNRDLKPQYSTTYEVGAKGIVTGAVQYDLSLFDTEVRDELIPFQVPDGSGRTYYRNAGRTRRWGGEAALTAIAGPVTVLASYSYSHFRFRDYQIAPDTNAGGNAIPGIPTHQLQVAATYRYREAYATIEALGKTSAFVNDRNTLSAAGYAITNIRVGGTALFGRPWLSPVFSVANVFDRRYVSSIAINATGGKYFEPAPGRIIALGLTLGVGR